jgi:hypothetical protein
VGAYALAYHTPPRYTDDIGILVRPSPELDGLTVPLLSKPCLIRNKRASGRDKDLEDLKGLS